MVECEIETWKRIWRDGFMSQMSDAELQTIRSGLIDDDCRIIQGHDLNNCSVIGYACFADNPGATIDDVRQYLYAKIVDADFRLNEVGACRFFLNWYDDVERSVMRSCLIEELNIELDKRSR